MRSLGRWPEWNALYTRFIRWGACCVGPVRRRRSRWTHRLVDAAWLGIGMEDDLVVTPAGGREAGVRWRLHEVRVRVRAELNATAKPDRSRCATGKGLRPRCRVGRRPARHESRHGLRNLPLVVERAYTCQALLD